MTTLLQLSARLAILGRFSEATPTASIASGIADPLSCPTFAITPHVQRGFCQGRQLSLNVVDVDAYMKAHYDLPGITEDGSNAVL